MITVKYDSEHLILDISGHAGMAEWGKDIVCAAVSSLSYALEAHLFCREKEYRGEIERSEEQAHCLIRAYPRLGWEARCKESFEVIMNGMRLLREYYPEYVEIEEGE